MKRERLAEIVAEKVWVHSCCQESNLSVKDCERIAEGILQAKKYAYQRGYEQAARERGSRIVKK